MGEHSETNGQAIEVVEPTICPRKSLDDDQLTLEVLNDLGLLKGGPAEEAYGDISSGPRSYGLIENGKLIID